jgi:hypothetical protein
MTKMYYINCICKIYIINDKSKCITMVDTHPKVQSMNQTSGYIHMNLIFDHFISSKG